MGVFKEIIIAEFKVKRDKRVFLLRDKGVNRKILIIFNDR